MPKPKNKKNPNANPGTSTKKSKKENQPKQQPKPNTNNTGGVLSVGNVVTMTNGVGTETGTVGDGQGVGGKNVANGPTSPGLAPVVAVLEVKIDQQKQAVKIEDGASTDAPVPVKSDHKQQTAKVDVVAPTAASKPVKVEHKKRLTKVDPVSNTGTNAAPGPVKADLKKQKEPFKIDVVPPTVAASKPVKVEQKKQLIKVDAVNGTGTNAAPEPVKSDLKKQPAKIDAPFASLGHHLHFTKTTVNKLMKIAALEQEKDSKTKVHVHNGLHSKSKTVETMLDSPLQLKPINVNKSPDNDIYIPNIMKQEYVKNHSYNSLEFARKEYRHSSSLALASSRELDLLNDKIDFVGDTESIKKLLMLINSEFSASFFLHRFRDTILVDFFDVSELLVNEKLDFASKMDWPAFRDFVLKTVGGEKERNKIKFDYKTTENTMYEAIHGLFYKCLEKKMEFKITVLNKVWKEKCERFEECVHDTITKFLNTYRWSFNDVEFLVGSHVPTFKVEAKDIDPAAGLGKSSPMTLTLGIHESDSCMSQQYGLEMWLENLMVGADGSYYCEHKNSFVNKTELLLTEDIPARVGVKNVHMFAEAVKKEVLDVIKHKVDSIGNTYWLFKGNGAKNFTIYNITEKTGVGKHNKGKAKRGTQQGKVDDNCNPFLPWLGFLDTRFGDCGKYGPILGQKGG